MITGVAKSQILFGPPEEGDQYKVSTEWTFKGEGGIFTIYDWKATDLYGDEYSSVEEFRSLPAYEWHIGAANKESALRFKAWVEKKLNTVAELKSH